jgi:hypothetical protein
MTEAGRRHALLALAGTAVAAAALALGPGATGTARAQDPRAAEVQRAARDWLALTDRFDSIGSRDAAGKRFRDAMTADDWSLALRRERSPLGSVEQRTLLQTRFDRSFPGFAEGDYALVLFRSAFAKRQDVRESVTLEREADGRWRVIGYALR